MSEEATTPTTVEETPASEDTTTETTPAATEVSRAVRMVIPVCIVCQQSSYHDKYMEYT